MEEDIKFKFHNWNSIGKRNRKIVTWRKTWGRIYSFVFLFLSFFFFFVNFTQFEKYTYPFPHLEIKTLEYDFYNFFFISSSYKRRKSFPSTRNKKINLLISKLKLVTHLDNTQRIWSIESPIKLRDPARWWAVTRIFIPPV